MSGLLGEYECKVDAKGRIRVPSDLVGQLGDGARLTLVVNRGFEKCIVMYSGTVWNRLTKQIDKLNTWVKKNRDFVRYFYRGASKVELDTNDRVLIPKRLLEYAGIDGKVVMFAYQDRVELWSNNSYDNLMEDEPMDFAKLAEDVMGDAEDIVEGNVS